MKKIGLLFVLFQFFFLPCFGQVVINEIMYNPSGNDNNKEFIEIFSDSYVNLSGWIISDESSNDTLTKIKFFNSSYHLIVEEGFNHTKLNISVYSVGATIGNNLNNGRDTIYLYDNQGNLIDSVTYDDAWGADGDGDSLQRINSNINLSNNSSNWIPFPSSPGKQNFYENATLKLLEILTDKEIYANHTTTIFVKIENRGMENATNISVNLSVNQTFNNSKINLSKLNITEIQFNLTFNETGNYTICAYLEDKQLCKNISVTEAPPDLNLKVYLEDTTILGITYNNLFKIENIAHITGTEDHINLTVNYWIYLGNSTNSTLIKNATFDIINLNSYKASNTGNWKPDQLGNFEICGKIIDATTTYNNTTVCKNISVIFNPVEILGKPEQITFGSLNFVLFKFEINNFSANYFKLNNTDLKFVIYSEGKKVIKDFNENIITSVQGCNSPFSLEVRNVSENFSAYIFLPFYITANCNGKIKEGNYLSKVRMFKLEDNSCPSSSSNRYDISEFKIDISGKNSALCPDTKIVYKTKEESKEDSSKTLEIQIINLIKELARNQEFATSIKLKNNADYKNYFEIYSYAYQGKKCITGGWTSNKMEVSLNKDEEKIINLTNKIKKDAEPGEYIFRVRVKIGGKQIDLSGDIRVTEEIIEDEINSETSINIIGEIPKLKIWTDKKLRINLSNCIGCKMIIVGPGVSTITNRKYRVFNEFGRYDVFVIKEGVILNQTYFWNEKTEENITEISEGGNTNPQNRITGEFLEVKPNWFENFFNGIKNLFSPLIELMEKSIQ